MSKTMTHDRTLFRLAGLAALAGALLRLVTAIPSLPLGPQASERLYMTIDLLLLLALVGLFAHEARLRRGLGPVGFAVSVLGFVLIRTGPRIGTLGTYTTAAAVLAIGLAVLGGAALPARGRLRWAGGAWIVSLLAGLAGAALHTPIGFLTASLLFCLGYAIAGILLLRPPATLDGN